VFGFDFSPKKTRARPRRRRTPTLHYIYCLFFFSRTATIKTISDYVTIIINNNNNIIMWSARVQSSGRLLLSRIVRFYNTPTVIYPPGNTLPPVQHNPARTFCRLPVPHRKSTTITTVCRKEIHLKRVLTRRFIIAQTAIQYNITCRHILYKYYSV